MRGPLRTIASIVGVLLLLAPLPLSAHELSIGLLKVLETDHQRYRVLWKSPEELPAVNQPILFPHQCLARAPSNLQTTTLRVLWWDLDCRGANSKAALRFNPSLPPGLSRVWVQRTTNHGETTTQLKSTTGVVPLQFGAPLPSVTSTDLFSQYVTAGLHHIARGLDHLLFFLGLFLLYNRRRQLILAVTSFTLGHSLTLGLASLGVISVRAPPVELLIAASLVLVGREILTTSPQQTSLMARHPGLLPGAFGLIHGFGFASAVLSFDLAPKDTLLTLFAFNLGVEIGQLLFLALLFLLSGALAPLHSLKTMLFNRLVPYCIGGSGVFWCLKQLSTLRF